MRTLVSFNPDTCDLKWAKNYHLHLSRTADWQAKFSQVSEPQWICKEEKSSGEISAATEARFRSEAAGQHAAQMQTGKCMSMKWSQKKILKMTTQTEQVLN